MGHKKLSGKIALVTGSSRGIGRAVVERLSREGAAVAVNYFSSSDKADEVVAAITSDGGTAVALQADVSSIEGVRRLFEQTLEHFGRLDVLVNNAGVRITRTVADTREDEFDRLFAINVKGPFFACQQAVHRISDGGRIINISSAVTRMMLPGYSIYAASKAAVINITQSAALALAPYRINVNAICPGLVPTPMWQQIDKDRGRLFGAKPGQTMSAFIQKVPLKRAATDEDIAGAVAFFCSSDADYITGQALNVDGGFEMD